MALFTVTLDAQDPSQSIRVIERITGVAADTAQRPGPLIVRVHADRIADAASRGGTIELPLDQGLNVRAAVRWATDSGTQRFLAGPLLDGVDGEVSLTLVDDTLVGRVVVGDRVFVVRQLPGSELHLIEEAGTFKPDADRVPPSPGADVPSEATADGPVADTNAFVDLLIVYTPAARVEAGGTNQIVAELSSAVNLSNTALANAGATHRFRLARLEEVAYSESGDFYTDLDRLEFANDGILDNVHTLRDQYRADVVTLVTGSNATLCGLANVMGPTWVNASFAPLAFNIVDWTCASSNMTLAHEIGHNMGLAHDFANAASTPSFSYAYGYSINGFARDVMAYACPVSCPRRTIYSTPLFNFPGTLTKAGTANEDTARALNNTSLVVANFRQQKTPTVSKSDFDFDNRAELTVYRPTTGEWWVRLSGSNFATHSLYQWGLPGDQPLSGDFDGDRKTDLTVWRPTTGEWYIRYSSLSYSPYAGNWLMQWGLPGDVPVVADFDGDGRAELTVWRPTTGEWYIRYSSLSYSPYAGNWLMQWGLPGDVPVVADFDGDGRAELTVWRPTTGEWYIRYSSLSYSPYAGNWLMQWGLPGDVPVVADFDGDGRAELTVWRPTTGEWYIRYSSLSYSYYAGNWLMQWGLPGDTPIPLDFDGDLRTDLAIYRPTTGEWYIRYSSLSYSLYAGNWLLQWGLVTDQPVR